MKGTFLSSETRAICRLLDHYGIDSKAQLRKAGLDPKQLEIARSRFPYDKVLTFWDALPVLTGNEAIGLEIGEYWRATDAHALGYALIASRNLINTFKRLVRYSNVINDSIRYQLTETDEVVYVDCRGNEKSSEGFDRFTQDMRWSVLIGLSNRCHSNKIHPSKVQFTYDKPDDITPYTSFFQCDIVFNADVERLEFSKKDAELEFSTASSELAEMNDRYLDSIAVNMRQDYIVDRIKESIMHRLTSGTPSANKVASDLSISSRTLNRRLNDYDKNYSQVLKEVRRELALKYIADPCIPITEISYLLGFADTSSFCRAFKSWTGNQAYSMRNKQH
jgi:AraC-like DNA-binding protein